MCSSVLAAFLSCLFHKEKFHIFRLKLGKIKYLLFAYLAPIIYAGFTYILIWMFGVDEVVFSILWNNPVSILVQQLTLEYYPQFFLLWARNWLEGFLAPRLFTLLSFKISALISGAILGLWHLPVLIFGGYNSYAPTWYAMLCFLIPVLGNSFLIT